MSEQSYGRPLSSSGLNEVDDNDDDDDDDDYDGLKKAGDDDDVME